MDQHFTGCPHVETDIDDFLIWGPEVGIHDEVLIRTLEKCEEISLTLNVNKCQFRLKEVTFLGYKLTDKGIQISDEKIKAILEMPPPVDVSGVRRLLGMVNFVARFMPNLSDVVEPLRTLLRKDVAWHWDDRPEQSFMKVKNMLCRSECLQYYDVKKPVVIQADASKSGLGAVLLQDGRPVAYASRAMTKTQQNYAMIEKELLAIVFG